MNTVITVTAIICVTIVLICLISEIGTTKKEHDDIMNKFKEEK